MVCKWYEFAVSSISTVRVDDTWMPLRGAWRPSLRPKVTPRVVPLLRPTSLDAESSREFKFASIDAAKGISKSARSYGIELMLTRVQPSEHERKCLRDCKLSGVRSRHLPLRRRTRHTVGVGAVKKEDKCHQCDKDSHRSGPNGIESQSSDDAAQCTW